MSGTTTDLFHQINFCFREPGRTLSEQWRFKIEMSFQHLHRILKMRRLSWLHVEMQGSSLHAATPAPQGIQAALCSKHSG